MLSLKIFFIVLALTNNSVQGLCTEGALRYDPNNNTTSLIQICIANQWGYICANNNDEERREEVADVVCRQMGYNSRLSNEMTMYITPTPLTPLHFGHFSCYNTPLALNLLQCVHYSFHPSNQYCAHGNMYVAATCTNNISECTLYDIKITNTSAIQLCVNGQWISICGKETWSYTQSQVACRQLGMNPIGAQPINISYQSQQEVTHDSIHNIVLHCHGDETSLFNCSTSLLISNYACYHSATIAGVKCGEQVHLKSPKNVSVNFDNTLVSLSWDFTPVNNFSHFDIQCNESTHYSVKSSLFLMSYTNNITLYGTLPDTMYTCCISTVTIHDESKRVCITNITLSSDNVKSQLDHMSHALSWFGGLLVGFAVESIIIILTLIIMKIVIKRRKDKQTLDSLGDRVTTTTTTTTKLGNQGNVTPESRMYDTIAEDNTTSNNNDSIYYSSVAVDTTQSNEHEGNYSVINVSDQQYDRLKRN